MHFGRGDNLGPNRSAPASMSMGTDIPGSNFHQQMGNVQRPGNMIPNHMTQMNYMNQQRHINQQMNNHQSPQQISQQQMHQMQHQRMLNHQRMMMMNAAHHNNSHSQLMRPSGPNMSKTPNMFQ